MEDNTTALSQGTWRVGRGHNIPLNHPYRYLTKPEAPQHLLLQLSYVANLIDQRKATWNINIIQQLYSQETTQHILSIPQPRIPNFCTQDTIIWPHTPTGTYQLKKAYAILHQDSIHNTSLARQNSFWKVLWKLKLPHKILTFIWKIIHHAIPIKTELNTRGINCDPTCSLCNASNESLDHLFLQCSFARALWLGVDINIVSIIANNIPMEQWIQNLAKKTQEADSNANALELILTTLWCIWTHRNNVIFEGKHPKPIDMLTIKSFFNKITLSNEDMSQGVLHNQGELKSQWNSIDNW